MYSYTNIIIIITLYGVYSNVLHMRTITVYHMMARGVQNISSKL